MEYTTSTHGVEVWNVACVVTRPSSFLVMQTLERRRESILSRNLTIFAQIDRSAEAGGARRENKE
jgi:hypothetical protein